MKLLPFLTVAMPTAVLAQSAPTQPSDSGLGAAQNLVQQVGVNSYGKSATGVSLEQVVGQVVQSLLGALGVIFLVLTVYAGYKWMLARGNEKDVTEAKDTLRNSIIGLAITLGGYVITDFVIKRLVSATTGAVLK